MQGLKKINGQEVYLDSKRVKHGDKMLDEVMAEKVGNLNDLGITSTAEKIDTAVSGSIYTINDDSVLVISPPMNYGVLIISPRHTNYRYYGAIFTFRAYVNNNFMTMLTDNANFETTVGELNGTTGADGKVTVSSNYDSKIYIENRCGMAVSVCLTFLGS